MNRIAFVVAGLVSCLPALALSQAADGAGASPDGEAGAEVAIEPPFSPDEASDEVRRAADLAVRVFFPADIPAEEGAREEADELRLRFAHALHFALGADYFRDFGYEGDGVEIYYQGRGKLFDQVSIEDGEDEGVPLERLQLPRKYMDGANWYTGVSGETGNQFEVRFPDRLARLVGEASRRNGFLSGTPGGEDVVDPPYKEGYEEGSQGWLRPWWHNLVPPAFAGIVGTDDRVFKGQLNTRHSSPNLSRIVSFVGAGAGDGANSRCTGTLFGRHHVITAAHCIVRTEDDDSDFGWKQWRHRVGRNGSDWYAEADSTTGWRWYWASSLYLAAAQAGSSRRSMTSGWLSSRIGTSARGRAGSASDSTRPSMTTYSIADIPIAIQMVLHRLRIASPGTCTGMRISAAARTSRASRTRWASRWSAITPATPAVDRADRRSTGELGTPG